VCSVVPTELSRPSSAMFVPLYLLSYADPPDAMCVPLYLLSYPDPPDAMCVR